MSTENTLMTDATTNTDAATSQDATTAAATQTSDAAAAGANTEQQASGDQQAQDAANTAEGQSKEGDDGAKGDEPKVPEKYEFKLPEDHKIDAAAVEAFSEFAKDAGLTQEAAQALMDKLAPAMQARQTQAVETAKATWATESKADKEFGGDAFNENLAVAKKAIDAFGSPELRTLLNESGLGNHPEIIRAFYRAGKSISEDRLVPSGSGIKSAGAKDPAKSLYPNQQS